MIARATAQILNNVQGRRVADGTAERMAAPQEDGSQSSRGFFGSFMRGSRCAPRFQLSSDRFKNRFNGCLWQLHIKCLIFLLPPVVSRTGEG